MRDIFHVKQNKTSYYSSFFIRDTSCIFAEVWFQLDGAVSSHYDLCIKFVLILDYEHHTSCSQQIKNVIIIKFANPYDFESLKTHSYSDTYAEVFSCLIHV